MNSGVSIELTPMIDMVFLLLIFFLVATTFHQVEREMQIALPVASSAAPISTLLQELIINVDQEGQIIVGGHGIEQFRHGPRPEQRVAGRPSHSRGGGGRGQSRAESHGSRGSPNRLLEHRSRAGYLQGKRDSRAVSGHGSYGLTGKADGGRMKDEG